jgi:tripartite-type tricarboxylate transporter receptor subunit TctC
MKKIIALFAVAFATATMAGSWFSPGFNWNNTNQDLDLIVNGSLTGGANSVAQLIAKDSQSGKFNGITLTAVAPGNACKGFALVKQRPNDTFVTYYENYYQLVAKQKNNAACPYISFENATPIVSYVNPLYLVVKTNKGGKTLADFSNSKLKVGYSGSGPEQSWHNQINEKFGQDHVFVGYSGSGNMRAGMSSEEVDAIWTTYSHFTRLKGQKDEYAIVMQTLDTLDIDVPVLAEHFNDATLSRAFLNAWYVFNDKNDIAKTISAQLEQDVKNNTGEFATYANSRFSLLTFDQPTQRALEKSLSWDQ